MKYKKDDIVTVSKCLNGHEFKIGELIRIDNVGSNDYVCYSLDDSDYWYLQEDELTDFSSQVTECVGKDEVYCNWYKCPMCENTNLNVQYKFCPDCGIEVDWSIIQGEEK